MNLVDNVSKLFSSKKTLKDFKVDDLRHERIRLEQTERKLMDQIETIEQQKRVLFQKGTNEASDRGVKIAARKMLELEGQLKNYDRNLALISRQSRVINSFIQIKENDKLMAESGFSSIISSMDLASLQTVVEQASVNGQFHMDKLEEILGTTEQSDRLSPEYGGDKDLDELVRKMQEAKAAEAQPDVQERLFNEANESMKARNKDKETGESN